MIDVTSRKLCLVLLVVPLFAAAADAALPPQYPDGRDSCRVVANAEPSIEYKPLPPGMPVAPGPGAGRVYTVPATLNCRAGGKHNGAYVCEPSFLVWAKEACAGLKLQE